MKGMYPKDKEAKPGKIFACAVLGSTQTEEAWVEVMDRIDAETQGRFPEASLLGGLRLEPPTSGRRIVTRGDRRATFDGPFLESKEVGRKSRDRGRRGKSLFPRGIDPSGVLRAE